MTSISITTAVVMAQSDLQPMKRSPRPRKIGTYDWSFLITALAGRRRCSRDGGGDGENGGYGEDGDQKVLPDVRTCGLLGKLKNELT